MPNPVVHFEVLGPVGDALRAFYGAAFDWVFNADNPMDYGLVENEGGIGGGVGAGDSASITFYIEVADLGAALDRIKAAGGEVVQEPMAVPGGPELAQFRDPAGNVIGLVKAGSG